MHFLETILRSLGGKTEFRNNFGSIFWEPRNLWLAFEDDGFGQPLTTSRHSAKRRKMKIPEIAEIQISKFTKNANFLRRKWELWGNWRKTGKDDKENWEMIAESGWWKSRNWEGWGGEFVKCPKVVTRICGVKHRFNIERRKLMKSISPKNDDKNIDFLKWNSIEEGRERAMTNVEYWFIGRKSMGKEEKYA